MYIMLGIHPDLAYAVGKLAHCSNSPSSIHHHALKRVFGYLQNTQGSCLMYMCTDEENIPYGFSDSDHAGDHSNSKSTSGRVFFLSGGTTV